MRRTCLEDAFKPWDYHHGEHEYENLADVEGRWRSLPETRSVTPLITGETKGIWGGTTEVERHALRHLPPEKAIERLDRTTEERMERRVSAYLKSQAAKRKAGGRPLGIRRIKERIDAILQERGRARCDSGA